MIVGSLGKVIFSVSSYYIKTIDQLNLDFSSNWAEHKIIGKKPKLQFMGEELSTASFRIVLSSFLNVQPLDSAKQLRQYLKNGEIVRFIMGNKIVGPGKYCITGIKEAHKKFGPLGNVTVLELDITLKEYN